ncbi:MAG: hypothetical protein Q9187_005379 [Circinaria calcarea]
MRKGNLVHAIQQIHEQYGPAVRLAPNEVSFIDPVACHDIYGHRPGHRPFPKNPVWMSRSSPDQAPSILNANDEDHVRIRRAWTYCFSEKSLKDQQPIISSHVNTLIRRLREQVDIKSEYATVDIVKWYNYTTLDIIGDLAFGESFDCLEEDRYHMWVVLIVNHFKAAVLSTSVKYYPLAFKLLMMMVPKEMLQKQKDHFEITKQKVQRRMSLQKDRPDFLSHLANTKHDLSSAEIESTAGIIIIAGSNSLVTTLAATTNYLTKYPDTLQKLTDEIRGSFNQESDMSFTNLSKLSYLNAVVEEGLRITAPVPLGMPRVVPQGGDTVCGKWLPAGVRNIPRHLLSLHNLQTLLTHSHKSLHSSNFAYPNEFMPERWLKSASLPSSPFAHDNKDAQKPFSVGPRLCIGFKLAYFELRLILARMVWNFDISLPIGPGSGLKWDDQKTYAVWVREPFVVRLVPT